MNAGQMTCSKFARFLLVSLAASMAPPLARAAIIDKANNALDLDQPGSWVGGVLPTSNDVVRWGNVVTNNNTVRTETAVAYDGIIIGNVNVGGSVSIFGGGSVHLNSYGIDMSAATQHLLISNPFSVSANQTWNIATGQKVTLIGSLSFGDAMVQTMGGTVEVMGSKANASQFTVGGTAQNPGSLLLNTLFFPAIKRPNGTGVVINPFGTVQLTGNSGNLIDDLTDVNVAGGTFDLLTHTEKIRSLDGTAEGVITNNSSTTATLRVSHGTFAGKIVNGVGALGRVNLTKEGSGTLTLSGISPSTGMVTVEGGTLAVTGSLANSRVGMGFNTKLTGDGPVHDIEGAGWTLSPGGENGTATFEVVDTLFLSDATLALQLNGASLGSYDRVSVGGTVNWAGEIPLELALGYIPGEDSFTILEILSGNAIGGLGGFTVDGNLLSEGEQFLLGGYTASISYVGGDGNDVVITVPEPGAAGLLGVVGMVGCLRRRRNG